MKIKFQIKKVIRYCSIYGIDRTMTKLMGRLQINYNFGIKKRGKTAISIIGCGQFAFSTICFFLKKNRNINFYSCFDIHNKKAVCLAKKYHFKKIESSFLPMLNKKEYHIVYIASNHFTHSEYAIELLRKNIDIYVEKPISVNINQLNNLIYTLSNSCGKIYAGYNRPFSQAIIDFKNETSIKGLIDKDSPFTINYYISGHFINKDHWYRDPKEGLRICGNVGHWLDLTVNLFNWRGNYPDKIDITVSYSNINEPDDNIAITIVTDKNDLISIVLTSRSEPFEGINETINIQYGNVIAKIDDFRKMVLWIDDILIKRKYWPKDVGHKKTILQPFSKMQRDWNEVELSTLLMLEIKEMVQCRKIFKVFSINNAFEIIESMRKGTFKMKEKLENKTQA